MICKAHKRKAERMLLYDSVYNKVSEWRFRMLGRLSRVQLQTASGNRSFSSYPVSYTAYKAGEDTCSYPGRYENYEKKAGQICESRVYLSLYTYHEASEEPQLMSSCFWRYPPGDRSFVF